MRSLYNIECVAFRSCCSGRRLPVRARYSRRIAIKWMEGETAIVDLVVDCNKKQHSGKKTVVLGMYSTSSSLHYTTRSTYLYNLHVQTGGSRKHAGIICNVEGAFNKSNLFNTRKTNGANASSSFSGLVFCKLKRSGEDLLLLTL